MSKFDWDEKYATHVHLIDEEHKFLFETLRVLDGINSTAEMPVEQKDEAIKGVIKNLLKYTATHFVVEEEMMRVYGYSEMAAHIAEHQKFASKVTYLETVVEESGFNMPEAMIVFLGNWLVEHIGKVDSKLGVFLTEKGQN